MRTALRRCFAHADRSQRGRKSQADVLLYIRIRLADVCVALLQIMGEISLRVAVKQNVRVGYLDLRDLKCGVAAALGIRASKVSWCRTTGGVYALFVLRSIIKGGR